MKPLSTAERATLHAILASGGAWDSELHMGAAKRGGYRKATVERLIAAGLVRGERVTAAHWANPRRLYCQRHNIATVVRYFATAAGCVALA